MTKQVYRKGPFKTKEEANEEAVRVAEYLKQKGLDVKVELL